METVDHIMESARTFGACSKSGSVSGWKTLVWLFFSPQGREFCENNNFPPIEMFRGMKTKVAEWGVWVDAGKIRREDDDAVALIGDTRAELFYTDPTKVHKVVLMHGAKAKIKASGYAVILLANIGECEVDIEKDETVVIL